MLDRCLPKQVAVTRNKRDWDQDILTRYRALVRALPFSFCNYEYRAYRELESIISIIYQSLRSSFS
jgi:hypothetical protein